MSRSRTDIKRELDRLVAQGLLLYFSMVDELGKLGDTEKALLKKKKMKLPSFKDEYDTWYSVSMQLVKQVLPDRLDDFVAQYKNEKRKDIDFLTYTVSDYLIGLQTKRFGSVEVDGSAALPKFEKQRSILASAAAVLDSALVDLQEVLQADLFDSELDAAAELGTRGFIRASGAVAGVVLEKHLGHVCELHGLKTRKKAPGISDYNQLLKDNGVIDTPAWRFIQHLGDLRNLCDHHKEREPTKEDGAELVEGVRKVSRTVF